MDTRKAVGALAESRLLLLPLFPMNRPIPIRIAALCGAAVALALPACDKPEVRVYTITKRPPESSPAPSEGPVQLSDAQAKKHARPQLEYQLPAGWKDQGPNQFSLVNFSVATPKGEATVNITPLAGMSGKDSLIVNMWRSQVDQPPLDDDAAEKSFTPVDIGGEKGRLFEVTGSRDGQTLAIITAFVHREDGSWFYKLQGNADAVASQKDAFINFLKTVKVKPGTETTAQTAPTAPPPPLAKKASEPAAPPTQFVVPEGWKEETPTQMVVAKFSVEKDGGHADVSVSVFESDTGGTLANVNRWRRMLGLGDVDESGLQECVTPLGGSAADGAPGPMLADISNNNRRLLGAIVPREGKWWFYKMVGDASTVNAEHDAFVQFVKSQP